MWVSLWVRILASSAESQLARTPARATQRALVNAPQQFSLDKSVKYLDSQREFPQSERSLCPERFELPTFWFVALNSLLILRNLRPFKCTQCTQAGHPTLKVCRPSPHCASAQKTITTSLKTEPNQRSVSMR